MALAQEEVKPEPLREVTITERQREIVMLLAAGHRQRAIAKQLEISLQTVKNHLFDARKHTGLTTGGLIAFVMGTAPVITVTAKDWHALIERVEALEALHE